MLVSVVYMLRCDGSCQDLCEGVGASQGPARYAGYGACCLPGHPPHDCASYAAQSAALTPQGTHTAGARRKAQVQASRTCVVGGGT